ncbi:MAG: hypothetical protein ACXACD_22485 [Candidatus Thorarchaeota archaeon]|jgi:hypothetical protein
MTRHGVGKYIIGIILIVVVSLTVITISANLGRRSIDVFDEPTHNETLWVQPENYTYSLERGFYSTQDDAFVEQNRYVAVTSIVRPFSEEQRDSVLYGIPKSLSFLWLRIAYYEEGEDEDLADFIVLKLTMGVPLNFRIEEHDFTLLIRPIVD